MVIADSCTYLFFQTGELPSALAGAGKFVLDNWSPLASAGQALVGRRNGSNSGGVVPRGRMALPAMGLGLTAWVAKGSLNKKTGNSLVFYQIY